METKVVENIFNYNLIRDKDTIVIGLSGGPDSMALLYTLLEVKKKIDFSIIIAHVNHGVREEALEDELFVKSIGDSLGIPYYSKTVDMVGYARENSISQEEAGRELRYGFFRDLLAKYDKGRIAVAHNKDDQAETLLMRIFRGTGIDGLKGMDFIQGDIIRPILNIEREEIEEYIEEKGIETVLDKTNLLPIYTRNQIRLELIPYIKENFNPNLINALWRLSEITSLDSSFLERYASERYRGILKSKEKGLVILDRDKFKKEDKSIRNRIIRKSIEELLNDLQGFSREHIDSVDGLFKSGKTGKELHLPREIIANIDYKDLQIYTKCSKIKKDFIYRLELGYNQFDSINYKINLKIIPKEDVDFSRRKESVRYFDYDKIKGNLFIRNRRDGDRFQPFGMKGSKKLKDFFIDEKISRDLRDRIPLIIDEENILWVIGYRTSELYKVDRDTEKVLMVSYQKGK